MKGISGFLRQRAQTTTEYLLAITVLIIGIVGASYLIYQYLGAGVEAYSTDIARMLNNGHVKP